jgi:hypothetical protein
MARPADDRPAGGVVQKRRGVQQDQEPGVDPAVEHRAGDGQQHVLRGRPAHRPVEHEDEQEEDGELELDEGHGRGPGMGAAAGAIAAGASAAAGATAAGASAAAGATAAGASAAAGARSATGTTAAAGTASIIRSHFHVHEQPAGALRRARRWLERSPEPRRGSSETWAAGAASAGWSRAPSRPCAVESWR